MRRDRDGRFRRAIGEDGLELLLKFTIKTAVQINAIKPAELERVVVDTTGMDKAIAYPVDSRLLEIARHKIVSAAKRAGITAEADLRQGKQDTAAQGRRLHAPQTGSALEEDHQAPAHDARGGDARGAAQAAIGPAGDCCGRCA